MTADEILKARSRLCLKIAEDIFDELGLSRVVYDIDDVVDVLEMMIPNSNVEAEAEMDALNKSLWGPEGKPDPNRPTLPKCLRKAVGCDPGDSLTVMLSGALKMVNDLRELRGQERIEIPKGEA